MNRFLSKAGMSYLKKGTGPVVIFIHGWAMASTVWVNQLDYFSGKGFTAAAPDLRGHGYSLDKGPYTVSQMASDLNDFIDEMGYNDLFLVGWSMGGMILLEYMERFPEKASSLILVGSTPRFVTDDHHSFGLPQKDLRAMQTRLKRDFHRAVFEFRKSITDGIKEANKKIILQAPLPSYDAAMSGLKELMVLDLSSELSDINIPVLVVHGSKDRVCKLSASRYMADSIPGAELLIIKSSDHAPFLHDSELFNFKVEEFLKKHG